MGCCICCFSSCHPKSCAITGIVLSAITFVFLIWGVADMVWPNKAAKAPYIIGFVSILLVLLGFIGILIIRIVRNEQNKQSLDKIGKIISILILVLCGIAIVCYIIAEIILIIKYADYEDSFNYIGESLPARWWITALFPGIMSIILIPNILKSANALLRIFSKNIDCPLDECDKTIHITAGKVEVINPNQKTQNTTSAHINEISDNNMNMNNPQITIQQNK